MQAKPRWRDHPARAELLSILRRADELVRPYSCVCASDPSSERAICCQFGVTGREPYPTPLELSEVEHALRATGRTGAVAQRKSLPLHDARRPCPLLTEGGLCSVYASRPFGCRTFFCSGHEPPRETRADLHALGRELASLSARHLPRDPLPRPLTRALQGAMPSPPPPPVSPPRRR